MHIAVSWDIAEGPNRTKIDEEMVAVFRGYSWIRPLSTFYVVKTDVFGRQLIHDALLAIGQRHPSDVRFLVSPLMQGGYLGYLNQDIWPQMNERTL